MYLVSLEIGSPYPRFYSDITWEEESADDDVRPLVQIALLFVPFNREVHFSFRIVRP